MRARTSSPRVKLSLLSLLGIVCVGLVLLTGVVQVSHSHASGQPDHDCSLCITAHHVIQVVAVITLDPIKQRVVVLVPEFTLDRPTLFLASELSSRPPPAVPAFA